MLQSKFKNHMFRLTHLVNRNLEKTNHNEVIQQNYRHATLEYLLETKRKAPRRFCPPLSPAMFSEEYGERKLH